MKKPGGQPKFDATRQQEIVAEYLVGDLSYTEMARKYGVHRNTILRWVALWRHDHAENPG